MCITKENTKNNIFSITYKRWFEMVYVFGGNCNTTIEAAKIQ
jgi:hypothetical protein